VIRRNKLVLGCVHFIIYFYFALFRKNLCSSNILSL